MQAMSKTEALRAAVIDIIGQHAPCVYYGQADPGHQKQYAIFELEELSCTDDQHVMELEVNCMDYGTDTSSCEKLADAIQTAFDHAVILNDEIMFRSYIERRQSVYEEDRKIIRRRLTFAIHLYERS